MPSQIFLRLRWTLLNYRPSDVVEFDVREISRMLLTISVNPSSES